MGVCGCRAQPKPADRPVQSQPPPPDPAESPPGNQLIDVKVAQKTDSAQGLPAAPDPEHLQGLDGLAAGIEPAGESGQEDRSGSQEAGESACGVHRHIQYGRKVSSRGKVAVWEGLDSSARMIAIKTVQVASPEPAGPCAPHRAEPGHHPAHRQGRRAAQGPGAPRLPHPLLRLQLLRGRRQYLRLTSAPHRLGVPRPQRQKHQPQLLLPLRRALHRADPRRRPGRPRLPPQPQHRSLVRLADQQPQVLEHLLPGQGRHQALRLQLLVLAPHPV